MHARTRAIMRDSYFAIATLRPSQLLVQKNETVELTAVEKVGADDSGWERDETPKLFRCLASRYRFRTVCVMVRQGPYGGCGM